MLATYWIACRTVEALGDDGRSFDIPDQRPGVEDVEAVFRAEWKKSVVHNALDRMREQVRGTEKEISVDVFARYRIEHEEGNRPTRVELGESFAMTLHQVHYALRWGEKEFFQFLRDELMDQVSTTEDFESEARELFGIA